ncbi:acetate kinase [uncultured Marinobacter sp.]|uniref:acetate/propionate family kinase n=1 Tax=uncultured Marinobacter sp. TaxID=187379 RepID=UPI0030D99352
MTQQILVVNCGSSSVKMAVFAPDLTVTASLLAERLGQPDSRLKTEAGDQVPLPAHADHQQALTGMIEWLETNRQLTAPPAAIGHRVVHGGESFSDAALIDDAVLDAIRNCAALAPLHNPVNLQGIEATRALYPDVPQVAVFDTAFHQTLPRHAYLYALPRHLYNEFGVRRYGFHGTSHSYMLEESARRLGKQVNRTSIISAHLGNGCSITAISNGKSVDTSMGLTPLEGLVMGTRSGDVDPGLFDFLAHKGISPAATHQLLNQDSGLKGLSNGISDMRSIVDAVSEGNTDAEDALSVFCFRLARYICAMMASLDHLDALVFTGGIGENATEVRTRTLAHLALAGFEIETKDNRNHGQHRNGRIEAPSSRFPVFVIATREEAVIARAAAQIANCEHTETH